jgi:hypothetical protein
MSLRGLFRRSRRCNVSLKLRDERTQSGHRYSVAIGPMSDMGSQTCRRFAETEYRLANCGPSGSSQLVLPNLGARRISSVWSETGAMLPMTWQ